MRSLLRSQSYSLAGRLIDPLSGDVVSNDTVSRLTARQTDLLAFLVSRQGEIVTRAELIDAIWEGNHLTGDRGVTDAIYHLRRALHDDDRRPLIKTVPRRGYVISSAHEVILDGAATDLTGASSIANGQPEMPVAGRRQPWRQWLSWPGAAAALLLIGLALQLRERENSQAKLDEAGHHAKVADRTVDYLVSLVERIDPLEARDGRVDLNRIIDDSAEQGIRELAEDPPVRFRLLRALAEMKASLDMPADAEALYREALTAANEANASVLERAAIQNGIAISVLRQQAFNTQDPYGVVDAPIALLESHGLTATREYFWAKSNQGAFGCYLLERYSRECIGPLEEAAAVARQLDDPRLIAMSEHSLASSLRHGTAESIDAFGAAAELAATSWGPDHPKTNHIRYHRAESLRYARRYADAAVVYQEVSDSLARTYGANAPTAARAQVESLIALALAGPGAEPLAELEELEDAAEPGGSTAILALAGIARVQLRRGACADFHHTLGRIDAIRSRAPNLLTALHMVARDAVVSRCADARVATRLKMIESGRESDWFYKLAENDLQRTQAPPSEADR